MPYNPGVTDQSGQLLAQGIYARANAIGQGMTAFGNTVGAGIEAARKMEKDRADAAAHALGLLQGDPELMKEVTADSGGETPIGGLFQKLQSGKAKTSDAQQLAGMIASRQFDQKQRQAQAQAKAEQDHLAALNNLTAMQAAHAQGMTDKARYDQSVAERNVAAMASLAQPTLDSLYSEGLNQGPAPMLNTEGASGQRPSSVKDFDSARLRQAIAAQGVTMSPETEKLHNALLAREEQSRLQGERNADRVANQKSGDHVIDYNLMVLRDPSSTPEQKAEATKNIKDRQTFLNTYKPDMADKVLNAFGVKSGTMAPSVTLSKGGTSVPFPNDPKIIANAMAQGWK